MEIARAEEGSKGFKRVFAFLRDRLLDGTLQPGDRLIAERDVAIQLGVSRPLVREALRALSMLGIVEIRDRVGTIVRRPDVSFLRDFLTLALAQQKSLMDDVMEGRIAIECQAVRMACERATISDFERFQRAVVRIGETIDELDAGAVADFEFHRAIVLAARSETLLVLYDSMAALLANSHRVRRELVDKFPSLKIDVVDDHKRVFDALVARDPDRAEAVLRQHLAIGDEYRHRAATEIGDVSLPVPARAGGGRQSGDLF